MNCSSRSLCYAVFTVVLSATITTPLRAQLLGAGRSDGDAPIIIRPDENADSPDADLVFAADAEQGDVPEVPAELQDPAFDRYLDLIRLKDAVRDAGAGELTDLALQMLEGERILLRNHRSGITGKFLLLKAADRAAYSGEPADLIRLGAAAEKLQESDLIAQVRNKQKLIDTSRSVAPAFTVSVTNTEADSLFDLKGWVDVVNMAASLGDRPVLELLKSELPRSPRLSQEQQDAIIGRIEEALQAITEPTVEDELLLKLAGHSRSDSDRQSVRNRIEAGGWYIVWGKTVAAGEYAKLVGAVASCCLTGNPSALYAYFQYLIQENVRKIKQQLPNLQERVITDAILRAIKGETVVQLTGVGIKGGIATYRYWHTVTVQVPDGNERYKINGPFGSWTWGYRPKYKTVTKTVPAEPNNHQPYFGIRLSRPGGSGVPTIVKPPPIPIPWRL